MINLPERGHRAALPWFVAGVVFYFFVSIVFFYTLLVSGASFSGRSLLEIIGLGESPNPSIAILVGLGILMTGVALASVARDLWEIRREEIDIDWLIRHKREYAQLVLAGAKERHVLRERGEKTVETARVQVETLVDDRVRRVMSTRGDGHSAMVAVEELRVIAQTRTARLGGFARYSSSLLLLLAVLGTFAGVKTALPGLIAAVTTGSQPGVGDPLAIVGPLQAVSDAFGANALALIGAIAVGLTAHGIATGRRNFLERLEWVSVEYIYGASQMESMDPLRTAVDAMRGTMERVHETAGALLGIEGGLVALGQQFARAFDSLDDRLTSIVAQQDERLHERTSHALEELRERVSELTEVVDANTRAYAGLVDTIGERSAEAENAIRQLSTANEVLGRGLEQTANLSTVAKGAGDSIGTSISQLERSSEQISRQLEALTGAVVEIRPSLEQAQATMVGAAEQYDELQDRTSRSLAEINERAVASWLQAGREMEEHIARIASGNGRVSSSAGGADATHLLQQIARSLDSRRPLSPLYLVLLPMAGVVVGGGVLYGIYMLVQSGLLSRLLDLVRVG